MLPSIFGCRESNQSRSELVERDSSGVTVIEVGGGAIDDAPMWTATPLVTIGASERADDVQLRRVSGAYFWRDERISIASDVSKQLLLFDRDGKLFATRGRGGKGPGEFLHVLQVETEDRRTVSALDVILRRLSQFSVPDSTPPTVLTLTSLSLGEINPAYAFANGDLLVRQMGPHQAPKDQGVVNRPETILRVSKSGDVIANYGVYPGEDRVHRSGPGDGLEAPYPRRLLVSVRDSVVYIAPMGPFQVAKHSANGRLRSILRVSRVRRRITPAIIKQYRDRVFSVISPSDTYAQQEWTTLSGDDVFPSELSGFDQLVTDSLHRLWIRESATDLDTTAWWVIFDAAGRPIGRLELPAPFVITDVQNDRILGVWNDHENPEQIRVYGVKMSAINP